MSKRISNKTHCHKPPARSRVCLGWKKVNMLSELERMAKAERDGNVEEEMLVKFADFRQRAKTQLKKFFPKPLRRSRGRG